MSDGKGAAVLEHRFQWTAPLMLSPKNPEVLYHAGERIFKKRDAGTTWEAISPDLTRNDKTKQQPSGGEITIDDTGTEYFDTFFASAESRLTKNLIWAGTDDGSLQITREGGIPEDSFVRAVREDLVKKGLLFAGLSVACTGRKDAGDHWESLQLNLPTVPVHDLVIKDNDLLLATHGRAFWILDDISPLRQASDSVVKADLWMDQPSPALGLHGSEEKESPTEGANAPVGDIHLFADFLVSLRGVGRPPDTL